jgi:hypothetical protein
VDVVVTPPVDVVVTPPVDVVVTPPVDVVVTPPDEFIDDADMNVDDEFIDDADMDVDESDRARSIVRRLARPVEKSIETTFEESRCVDYKFAIVSDTDPDPERPAFEFGVHRFRIFKKDLTSYKEVYNTSWDWRVPIDTCLGAMFVRSRIDNVMLAMADTSLPLNITEHDLLVAFGCTDDEGRALVWHVVVVPCVNDDVDRPVTLHLQYAYTYADNAEEEMAIAEMDAVDAELYEERDASDDGDGSVCAECGDGGELLICDSCDENYHLECVGLSEVPPGEWRCPSCVADGLKASRHVIDLTGDTPPGTPSQDTPMVVE